jgi:membrane associated rhomboid family serine protease
MVAWSAHLTGFTLGMGYGLYVRAAIARRLRKRKGF